MTSSIHQQLELLDSEERHERQRLQELQKEVRESYETLERKRTNKQALRAYNKANPAPATAPAPSELKHKKNEKISPEVEALVAKKVLYEGSATWEEAISQYDISHSSVGRILRRKKRKIDGEETPVAFPNKRGRKTLSLAMFSYICSMS